MENTLFNLRQWLHRLRKKYQRKTRRQLPVHEGLPEGVQMPVLEAICAEYFQCSIESVSHLHLSGWKSSGAYRLVIRSTQGKDFLLIYKNANYADESIPALVNLPVKPGPPEYEIYRQANGVLARYLPKVYRTEEVVPGNHYRYILEDLHRDYHIMRGEKVYVSGLLPELHDAMEEWAATADTLRLIPYGKTFSVALEKYAFFNLEQYCRQSKSNDLRSVLSQWTAISNLHLQPEFFTSLPRIVHGDANFSNIHLHRNDPKRFKVVDWEWAGFGTPYADLTAMLKGAPADIEKQAFSRFIRTKSKNMSRQDEKREYRLFLWSNLERCMLDAAFLAAQQMNSPTKSRINLETAVLRSLSSMLMVYRQLS